MNKYRLMHDASPLGYCSACAEAAAKWAVVVASSGHVRPDHQSKYGQTIFVNKDQSVLTKGADYLGTLIAATW